MNKRTTMIIGLLLGGAVLTYVIFSAIGLGEVFTLFENATWVSLIGYISASAALALFMAYKWYVIVKITKPDIKFWPLFRYRMMGFAVSYMTPSAKVGGEPVRAYMLKREGVDIKDSFSGVIIDKSVEIFIHIMFFAVGITIVMYFLPIDRTVATTMGIVATVLAIIGFVGMYGLVSKKHKLFRRLFRTLHLHKIKKLRAIEKPLIDIERRVEIFFTKHRGIFYYSVLLNTLTWVFMYFEYWFALQILGHFATAKQIFLMLSGVAIAYLAPVPLAIGALEVSQVVATTLLILPNALGVALGLIVRARDLTWTAVGGIFLMASHLKPKVLFQKSNEEKRKFEAEKH